MKLYHYSEKKKILKEGLISSYKHEDTLLITNLINQYGDDIYGRNDCVFLTFKLKDFATYIVSVESTTLNENFLLVADLDLANEIYSRYYQGKDVEESVKKYIDSIINFKDYKQNYRNPEVLYQGDIPPHLLKVEIC